MTRTHAWLLSPCLAALLAACQTTPETPAPETPADKARAPATTSSRSAAVETQGRVRVYAPECEGVARRLNGDAVSEDNRMTLDYAVEWLRGRVTVARETRLTGDKAARWLATEQTLLEIGAAEGPERPEALNTVHLLFLSDSDRVVTVYARDHCYYAWGYATPDLAGRLLRAALGRDVGT